MRLLWTNTPSFSKTLLIAYPSHYFFGDSCKVYMSLQIAIDSKGSVLIQIRQCIVFLKIVIV